MANEQRTPWSRRARIMAAALFGWVVVVVVGAGTRSDDTALLGVDNLNVVFIVLYLAMALVGLILLIVLNPFSRKWSEPKPRRKFGGGLLLLVLVLLVWRPDLIENFRENFRTADTTEQDSVGLAIEQVQDPEPPAEPVAQATDLLLLLAAAGVAGGVWLWVRRQEPGDGAASPGEADQLLQSELVAAIDQATIELGAGDDPRAAVLNAYARLEAVLASRGDRRRPAETAAEHIAQVLSTIRIDPSSLIRLGELYEVARFSQRAITVQDQAEAARALETARRQLAALT